uniref:RING-type E3 ubiquitin transferase n=1 Tax=Rhizophora mucronata TaxID=61149 RepID=A0A2P2KW40_RHIMU
MLQWSVSNLWKFCAHCVLLFMFHCIVVFCKLQMANETVRSTRADERIRTTFMAGTSSIRAHEERVNETVRSTRENERSSIREPTEGKFDGSNGIVGCVICQEQLLGGDEVTGMPCSHVFHVKCIEKWLEQSRSCPLCRLDLP